MRRQEAVELKSRLEAGGRANPFWICGPCVIEDRKILAQIAETLVGISQRRGIPVVFKASFDKANRTSVKSFRGEGLEKGLEDLLWVKSEFGLPILTDIHETIQAPAVAEVVDILQIPAFLSRQTDLIEAACGTDRLVNVKKGQFLAPSNVSSVVEKLEHYGAPGYWLTERGVSFGYQRLVVDFAALPEMERATKQWILDVTHAVQLPGASISSSGGIREAIPYLARAGAAVGFSGFFAETHPNPEEALSDSANAWPLGELESLMVEVQRLAEAAHGE